MRLLHRILLPCILLVFGGLLLPKHLTAKCIYLQPIEIKKIDVGNMLSWSTYQEIDNKFFVIEKSVDGVKFKKVGDVKGAGFSNSINTYRFLDFSLGENKTFYRIKHLTSNGGYTVSETFLAERTTQNNFMITSMSSTMTDKILTMTIKAAKDTSVTFSVKKRNGRVIQSGERKMSKGYNVLSFDVASLPVGKFEVLLKSSRETEKINFRKVRSSEMPKVEYEVKRR